jgi:hypothetical protein
LLCSPLALLVARIPGTDDADRSVAFDDLAEFASALHRSSDFHNLPASPKFFWLFETAQKHQKSKPSITPPYPFAHGEPAALVKLSLNILRTS